MPPVTGDEGAGPGRGAPAAVLRAVPNRRGRCLRRGRAGLRTDLPSAGRPGRLPPRRRGVRGARLLDGSAIGLFLGDFYTRPGKQGGAWMESLVAQNRLLDQLPVVVNNLNLAKPPAGQPTLLSHGRDPHPVPRVRPRPARPAVVGDLPAAGRDRGVEGLRRVPVAGQRDVGRPIPQLLARYARHVDTGEPLPARPGRGPAGRAVARTRPARRSASSPPPGWTWPGIVSPRTRWTTPYATSTRSRRGPSVTVGLDVEPHPAALSQSLLQPHLRLLVRRRLLLLHLERDPRRRHRRVVRRAPVRAARGGDDVPGGAAQSGWERGRDGLLRGVPRSATRIEPLLRRRGLLAS